MYKNSQKQISFLHFPSFLRHLAHSEHERW